MHLNSSLLEYPISEATQKQVLKSLCNTTDDECHDAYFQYYTEQCRMAFHVDGRDGRRMQSKTHQHIFDIVIHVKNGLTRKDIQQLLVRQYKTTNLVEVHDSMFDSSIDLAVRLVTMLDVGEPRKAFSGRRRLIWDDGPLLEFVKDIFPENMCSGGHDGIKLGTSFTAVKLDQLTGFEIELTTNLADHLRLRNENRTVAR